MKRSDSREGCDVEVEAVVVNTWSRGRRYARGGSSSFAVTGGLTGHKVTDRETSKAAVWHF